MFEAIHARVMCWWCAVLAFILGLISVNDKNLDTAMIFIVFAAFMAYWGWRVEKKG